MTTTLLVVGGGKMGEALVGGLLRAEWTTPERVVVVDNSPERLRELESPEGLAGRYPGLVVSSELSDADGAIVAVKPADVTAVCRALAGRSVGRVLSIATGVPLARLEQELGGDRAVIRAMPNTPALVGMGASVLVGGSAATESDLAWAESILAAVGTVARVTESQLDAVTGLSGSGPAYVYLVVEALIDAGVLVGLPRPLAQALAVQTLLGSSQLLAQSGESPQSLRAAVTSPGGTTAAGLAVLERAATRAAFADAVVAAAERARQLAT